VTDVVCKMASARSCNKNVTCELVVEADASRKSFVWQYYGALHRKSDTGTDVIDNETVRR